MRAAQALLSSSDSLSDQENDSIIEVVTQLDKLLPEGKIYPDDNGQL
jgi:hypothetical protein